MVTKKPTLPVLCTVLSSLCSTAAQALECPAKSLVNGTLVAEFPDHSVALRGGLNVNPDGARASYTVGNHGFTYIANGLDLWEGGVRRACKNKANTALCNTRFDEAERRDFAAGTAEFCVFAMEVEPLTPGGPLTACKRGKVAGNGKGRLRVGGELPNVSGGKTAYYSSTTALNQLIDGTSRPIDSSLVPSVVVPVSKAAMVGHVVWVSFGGMSSFAVVGDTGPAFGEGSVALHQLLRDGQIESQAVGPIAWADRCSSAELSLRAPFESRPDRAGDNCKPGKQPLGAADIRAYKAISAGVTEVILGRARLQMQGTTTSAAVTLAGLQATAMASYAMAQIEAMARCLD